MYYTYSVIIHKDAKSDFGVTVPDLPGCFSAGVTLDDALCAAQEAIEAHLELLMEEDSTIPVPRHLSLKEAAGAAALGVIRVNTAKLGLNAVRFGVTMPERAAAALDRWTRLNHQSRSGAITRAVWTLVGKEESSFPAIKQGGARVRVLSKASNKQLGRKSQNSKKARTADAASTLKVKAKARRIGVQSAQRASGQRSVQS